MKKTLLITSVILAFFCFSCENEVLDSDIVVAPPTNNGGNNGGGNGGGNNGGGNNGGGNGTTLTTYTYDTTSTVPIFGDIIVNTDFNISQGVVTSQNIESTLFGMTVNSLSTYTRDTNGKVVLIEDNAGGAPQNRTTVTYTGDNITQIEYEFFDDPTENYTYTFAYAGNVVTKTIQGTTQTAEFTFDANSRLTKLESFDGGTSTKVETLSYGTGGNCTEATVEANGTTRTNTFTYDAFSNPLNPIFNDLYLLSVFNGDHEDEIGATIANFHGANNWIGGTGPEGSFDFNPQYDTDNKIVSKGGTYDLGDGVIVTQSEVYQYQ